MNPSPSVRPTRVFFYGVTGSGKSTAASKYAEARGLPLFLVDDLTWLPGWVEAPEDEQRAKITEICGGDEWVLDTAYGDWMEVPLARAELIVGLDYPRFVSLTRLIRRTVTRVVRQVPVCNGNTETWRRLFSRDSIVAWHFKSFKRKRDRMRSWDNDPDNPEVMLFRHPAKLASWLDSLGTHEGESAAGEDR